MAFKFNPFTGTFDIVDTTKSDSFGFERSGNVAKNTFLLHNEIPSNKCGHSVTLSGTVIRKISTANEDPDVIVIEFYSHDGDGISLTLLGSVTTLAQRTNSFNVVFPVAAGKQIAVKTANLTGNTGKNLIVNAIVKGTLA